jgi:hypothetical protein
MHWLKSEYNTVQYAEQASQKQSALRAVLVVQNASMHIPICKF